MEQQAAAEEAGVVETTMEEAAETSHETSVMAEAAAEAEMAEATMGAVEAALQAVVEAADAAVETVVWDTGGTATEQMRWQWWRKEFQERSQKLWQQQPGGWQQRQK